MRVFRSLANPKSGAIFLAALALIMVFIIAAAYRSAIDDIDSLQRESARDYAARTRVWVTGAARTMVAAAEAAQYADQDKSRCDELLREATAADPGYQGLRIDLGDGRVCARAKNSDLAGLLEGASRDLETKTRVDVAPNLALAAGNVHSGAENFLAIQIDAPATADIKGKATALDRRARALIGDRPQQHRKRRRRVDVARARDFRRGRGGCVRSGLAACRCRQGRGRGKGRLRLPDRHGPLARRRHFQLRHTARSRSGALSSYPIRQCGARRCAMAFPLACCCDAAARGLGHCGCLRDSSRLLAVDRCDQGGDAGKKGRKGAGACARSWRYAGEAARACCRLQ